MNKFFDQEGTLLDDLDYTRRLEDVKKKLAEQMRQEFSLSARSSEPLIIKKEMEKFCSHPRNCSGSDTTLSGSPRKSIISSCVSNANVDLENLGRNKIKAHSKKLHKKWTQNRPSSKQHIEIDIGDNYEITPINTFRADDIKEELKVFYTKLQKTTAPINNAQSPAEESLKTNVPKVMNEANFEKKFKTFVEKSLQTINDITTLMDKGIEPPDGDEDISRRTLRVKEFSNRFSRNYLYPLVRQIDEFTKWKSHNPINNQKLLSAYQVIFNGLQAYQNHLPTSIGACSSDKLKLLLKHVLDLCDIHYKLLPQDDENAYKEFIMTYKLNAEMTLQKIEDHFTNHSGCTTSVRLSAPQFRTESQKSKKSKSAIKNNLEERLYMYNTTCSFRKDPLWRKAAEALARNKNKVKSRYKTALFKHRPPITRAKTEILEEPSQSKLSIKKSSGLFKTTKPIPGFHDDDISTMIQMDDENDNNDENIEKQDENKGMPVNHEEIVMKLLQLVLDINARKKDSNSEENLKRAKDVDKIMDILEKLKNGEDFDSLKDVLKELQSNSACRETLELKIIQSSESFPDISTRKKKEPTVTVTGVKNAKLICIQDDNSIIETDDNEEIKNVRNENKTDSDKENKNNHQRPSTSLSVKRSSKSSKCLQMLPKDYAVNIIQYKIDFSKHCKRNPMYKRTTKILPWMLMNKISDEILNLALLGVAKEVEISEVVEKIYQSELQFC